ncbi:hypothetical protein DENSPDRAFT_14940 [Dentipellis sp. KUC8613]|nr:hypothetical protein DENSPDRAFT_14940 [Dentipellis sp. KUC8613]
MIRRSVGRRSRLATCATDGDGRGLALGDRRAGLPPDRFDVTYRPLGASESSTRRSTRPPRLLPSYGARQSIPGVCILYRVTRRRPQQLIPTRDNEVYKTECGYHARKRNQIMKVTESNNSTTKQHSGDKRSGSSEAKQMHGQDKTFISHSHKVQMP